MNRISSILRLGVNINKGLLTSTKTANFVPQKFRTFCTMPNIFDVETTEDFSEKVIQSPVPVIVDFHAEWCGPCQALGPRLEEKINGRGGQILLAKINVDYAGEIAMDYGITAVPTVFAFKNGEKISGFSGVIDDEQLDDFIDDAINA